MNICIGKEAAFPVPPQKVPALPEPPAPTHGVGRAVSSVLVLRRLVALVGGDPVVHKPAKRQSPGAGRRPAQRGPNGGGAPRPQRPATARPPFRRKLSSTVCLPRDAMRACHQTLLPEAAL